MKSFSEPKLIYNIYQLLAPFCDDQQIITNKEMLTYYDDDNELVKIVNAFVLNKQSKEEERLNKAELYKRVDEIFKLFFENKDDRNFQEQFNKLLLQDSSQAGEMGIERKINEIEEFLENIKSSEKKHLSLNFKAPNYEQIMGLIILDEEQREVKEVTRSIRRQIRSLDKILKNNCPQTQEIPSLTNAPQSQITQPLAEQEQDSSRKRPLAEEEQIDLDEAIKTLKKRIKRQEKEDEKFINRISVKKSLEGQNRIISSAENLSESEQTFCPQTQEIPSLIIAPQSQITQPLAEQKEDSSRKR